MKFNQTKEEFLSTKKSTFGGSEVSIILGISNFDTRYKLWLSKKNATLKDLNKYMEAGSMLEAPIIKRFYDNRNFDYSYSEKDTILCYSHPEHDFIIVHPDDIFNNERLLEAKTTQKYLTKETVEKYVKDTYFHQWNFTLGIILENEPDFITTGFLVILSRGLDYFEVLFEFDEKIYKESLEAVIAFNKLLEDDIAPELERGDFDLVYSFSKEGAVVSDVESKEAHTRLLKVNAAIKTLEDEKERLTIILKSKMKENDTLIDSESNRILATWKSTKRSRVFKTYDN